MLNKISFFFVFLRKTPISFPDEEMIWHSKIRDIITYFMLEIILIIPIILVLSLLDKLHILPENANKLKSTDSILEVFLFGAFIMPIFEEFFFRSHLTKAKWNFSFCLLALLYFLLFVANLFDNSIPNNHIFKIIAIPTIILIFLIGEKLNLFEFWKQNFGVFFYIVVITFASVHLTNFDYKKTSLWLLPILISPQILSGLFFGFIRIRYGIIYSILFHSLGNSTLTILKLLLRD